ncbi:MAG: hypothetical protein G01um101456_628 [Parcubacteria group bacterium Gr01-1014_56]|nr:MAG: hypothetical protein G01um101456_628 [Parcubacteria group bacterium Gr01-1014_56]
MRKRIIYIVIISLVILALILGLWFWFFGGGGAATQTQNLFGTGSTTNNGGGTGGDNGGNAQAPIGSTVGGGVSGTGGGVNTQIPIGQGGFDDTAYVDLIDISVEPAQGIIWNNSAFSGGSGWIVFNPTPINSLNNSVVVGDAYITNPAIGADGKPINLLTGLASVVGGCIAQYGLSHMAVRASPSVTIDTISAFFDVRAFDKASDTATQGETIVQCLVRTLGKVAVQQITDSTVNWINSGFDGKPAFVQDYNQFFTGVADQAAGEFLQSSNFAFLCSPFKLQVRIAVAQAYARRNVAPSCTLTQAVGNVQNFLDGNFREGGWGGLIAFTTEPSNNPFGAYMALTESLDNAVANAKATGALELDLGQGFMSVKKCDPPGSSNCKIVTPGIAISESLSGSIKANFDSLQIGDSINQILAALQNALITKILYGGLSNVNKKSTSTTNVQGQTQAETLMDELQAAVATAQQYASVEQRIIVDTQTAQQNLTNLQNCWVNATSSSALTPAQLSTAQAGASAAALKVAELEGIVALHNSNITNANSSIAAIQEIQTDLLFATVAADVTAIQTRWNAFKTANNPRVYTALDVISVQQDRASLQSSLANLNIDTSAKLQQCHALGL